MLCMAMCAQNIKICRVKLTYNTQIWRERSCMYYVTELIKITNNDTGHIILVLIQWFSNTDNIQAQ